MSENKYPSTMSFIADGGKERVYYNISKIDLPSTIFFDDTKEVIDSHICQFLNSTREMELEDRKLKLRFITRGGKKKTNYTPAEWEAVSKSIGFTSVLSLLYRKRIKLNYRDIETYLCQELNPDTVYRDLIRITSSINMVHEAFIIKALGQKWYNLLYKKLCPEVINIITKRKDDILNIIAYSYSVLNFFLYESHL